MKRTMRSLTTRRLAWQDAARAVMTPLVRALLREGLRRADLTRLIDEALICAAIEEGADSVAALRRLTGLTPKAVGRGKLRLSAQPALAYRDGVRLVSRWTLDAPWASRGRPRPLPRRGRGSFAALAELVGVDPRATLDVLRRLGLVRVRGTRVFLTREAYIPAGMTEKIDILGRDGAEFLRAIIHNIGRQPAQSMLQRKASYDNVGSAALEGIRARLRAEATRVLAGVNQALAKVDRDRNPTAPGGRRMRVSFGVYLVEEPFSDGRGGARRKSRRPSQSR